MGDVVQRGGHEVDRNDVRVAELGADQGKPAREVVPGHLDRGEEVVRPVDLVHLAGLRMPRPRWPGGRRATASWPGCGPASRTRTSTGDRGDRASAPHRTCPRGTAPCSGRRRRSRRRDGSARLRARWPGRSRCACPRRWLRGCAPHRRSCRRPRRRGRSVSTPFRRSRSSSETPSRGEPRSPSTGLTRSAAAGPQPSVSAAKRSVERCPDEDVDVPVPAQQPLDEVAADEAGRTRDEVGHRVPGPTAPVTSRRASRRWPCGPWPRPCERACACPGATGSARRSGSARGRRRSSMNITLVMFLSVVSPNQPSPPSARASAAGAKVSRLPDEQGQRRS